MQLVKYLVMMIIMNWNTFISSNTVQYKPWDWFLNGLLALLEKLFITYYPAIIPSTVQRSNSRLRQQHYIVLTAMLTFLMYHACAMLRLMKTGKLRKLQNTEDASEVLSHSNVS